MSHLNFWPKNHFLDFNNFSDYLIILWQISFKIPIIQLELETNRNAI